MISAQVFIQRWTSEGERFDTDGNLVDAMTQDKIDAMLAAFNDWIRLLVAGKNQCAGAAKECEKTVN